MRIPLPLPRITAFEELGFGLFVHWGLYSQLGMGEWAMLLHHMDMNRYLELQKSFTAEDFDAEKLARTAKNAGLRYIVLTTRHHEGFSLYDTAGLNEYDAPHSPAGRDLIAEFVSACRKFDIKPFFYHTTLDWSWRGKKTPELSEEEFLEYLDYLQSSVELLCRNYGPIGGLWFDGNWCRKTSDWHEDKLYGMIRKYQPDAIIVNNTGLSNRGVFGHPEIDSVTFENGQAAPLNREEMPKYVAGEVCLTLNSHWGLGANDYNFKSPGQIIERLCQSRRCGANLLLNIGPTAQGGIPLYEQGLLETVGRWISSYKEAVYLPRPVVGIKCQGRDFMLQSGRTCYYFAHDLGIHGGSDVTVNVAGIGTRPVDGFAQTVRSACWMDNGQSVEFVQNVKLKMLSLKCTGYLYGTDTVVRVMKLELG